MTDFTHTNVVTCPDCGLSFCPDEGDCPECASRREAAFQEWLDDFIGTLIDCGMPAPQAQKYRDKYEIDARDYFQHHYQPGTAAAAELMGEV